MKPLKFMLLMVFILLLTACGVEQDPALEEEEIGVGVGDTDNEETQDNDEEKGEETMAIDQFAQPVPGETIAEMHIKDYGVIKLRLFPEVAPKAVENFVTHAENGYYEGVIFHRVMQDFMIQGGDPTGTGAGGESIWGGSFEDEFSQEVFPYRGALCMANAGPNTNGSQFFVVQLGEADPSMVEQMTQANWPQEVIENYQEHGGTPWLFYAHTVFGHVYEGMDVVDAIAATEVTPQENRPLEEVVIERIEIKKFAE